jgi:hypothetical protein
VEEFKQLALSDVEKLRRIVLAKVQQLGKSTVQSKLDRYIRQNGCKYEMFVKRLTAIGRQHGTQRHSQVHDAS